MRFTRALVGTDRGSGHYTSETKVAVAALRELEIPIIEGTPKLIRRKRVHIDQETLVVGNIPFIHTALHQLGLEPQEPDDYPAELHRFLHRRIWTSTLRHEEGRGNFVKPKKLKRFTGRVLDGLADPFYFNGASRRTEVWVSEPVTWLSEYRCFVAHGRLLGHRWYDGDRNTLIDLSVVQEAVQSRVDPPWGYTLDFGKLSTGETALIEANLAYSMGDYGLDPRLYLECLAAGWDWLTR